MTDAIYRAYRAALRSPARPLILALERRGCRLRAVGRQVHVRPSRLLTAADRDVLREHAAEVSILVNHRDAWCEWPRPVPPFDPTLAFSPPQADARVKQAS